VPEKRKVKASSKAKAAARLRELDRQYEAEQTKRKKNVLRTKARMGDRKTRTAAARELNKMPRGSYSGKPKQQN